MNNYLNFKEFLLQILKQKRLCYIRQFKEEVKDNSMVILKLEFKNKKI